MIKNLNKKTAVSILISLLLVFVLIFSQSKKLPTGNLEIMKAVFRGASITAEKENIYRIKGDDKKEYDLATNLPITDKEVTTKFIKSDIDNSGTEKIIAISSVRFIGQVCIACGGRLYIDVLSQEKNYYNVSAENEFSSVGGSDLFLSDINIRDAKLVDLSGDGSKNLEVTYKADSIIGLDKEKVAIFQWANGGFKLIWQQITHINMDNYGRLQKEDKQNYDATFRFEKSNSDHANIIVEKIISSEQGVTLPSPKKENLIYKFNGQEYKLWKEEKVKQ